MGGNMEIGLLVAIAVVVAVVIMVMLFSNYDIETDTEETNEKKIQELQDEITKKTKEILTNSNANNEESDMVDLCLDGMILISTQEFGDAIDILKNNTHPYLKLISCHIFVEQLSDNFCVEKNNSTYEFADAYLRSKLNKEQIDFNMLDEVDEETNEPYIFIALSPLQERIITASSSADLDATDKLNLTIELCSQIASLINDDDLIEEFVSLSTEYLKNKDLYNQDIDSVYLSIGV